MRIFQKLFSWRVLKCCIFQHLQKRLAEIRGKNNFWSMWVWVPNAYKDELIIIPKLFISDDTSSTLWHHVPPFRPITYPTHCPSHSSGGKASDSRHRPPGYTRSPGSRRFGARFITASWRGWSTVGAAGLAFLPAKVFLPLAGFNRFKPAKSGENGKNENDPLAHFTCFLSIRR